jgi:hypothetical protein
LAGLTTNHTTGKPSSRGYWLQSAGDRQVTYDGENNVNLYSVATLMIDSDNHWISPGQAAGVDAQYYANVVDDYFLDIHGRDSYDNAGAPMRSVVHAFSAGAFWRGSYVIYGDSSTSGNFGPSSGALDVVGHEWTHGVTEFTSGLINQDESGALNEAFSDIIGTSIEFYAEDHNLDPAATPDFWMGEDVDLRSDPEEVPGGRNLADPEEDGHPDHYSELVITTDDFGGVHTNNGIPNHAYYLLVNGGFNASCASPTDHNSAHCTGGVGDSTPVMPIGLTDAEQIFYLAFTGLSSTATMADARAATEATASSRFGPASQQLQSTIDAWITVGVGTIPTGGAPTANAGPDQTVGDGDGSGDAVVTLIGSGSDSDGTIVIYEWKEGTTVLGSTASISPVLTVGGHTLTLTVTDDEGFTGSDTVVVTVNANQAPTADAGPDQTVTDGDSSGDEQVTLNGSGSDSDGTIFGYEWKEGTTVIGTTEIISPTLAVGSHALTLTVTDNGGETGTDTVVVTVSDGSVPTTKFFVADDDVDQTFEYDAGGTPGGTNWNLASGNTDPRGAASDGTGTQVWIVDSDKRVYVYDDDGVAQGSWSAKGGLKRPEGIASDGTDIWIVDTNSDKVLRYSGAAARTAGNQGSSGSFALAAANPTGITTDGTTIWVVDSGTDRFYEYDTVGGSLGDWPLVGGSSNPTGITIDPSGTSNDIWVVDNGSNSVSRYDRDTGSFIDSFALAVGNANPQGIADPPPRSQIGVEHDWIASRPVAGPLDFRPLNNTARARLLTKTTHVSNTTLPTFVESDTPSVAGLSAIWKATSKTRHGLMAHDQAIEDLADGELLANDFVEQLSHAFHRSQ